MYLKIISAVLLFLQYASYCRNIFSPLGHLWIGCILNSSKLISILKFWKKKFWGFFSPEISFHFQQGERLLKTQSENIITRENEGPSLMETLEKNNAGFDHVCRWTKTRNTVTIINRCHLFNTCKHIIQMFFKDILVYLCCF